MIPFSTGTCLFENRRKSRETVRIYENPISLIEAHAPSEIAAALGQVDAALAKGRHVAGYISYDAGYALEPRLQALTASRESELPLLRFWIYDDAIHFGDRYVDEAIRRGLNGGHVLSNPLGDISEQEYVARIEEVLELIRAGDIYQANFTFPLRGELTGDALSLYAALRVAQPVSYGAFLRMEDADILSLSPELFVARQGNKLLTRPMKGTAARATGQTEDAAARTNLRADPKERAENLMIVDLLRNDLSRICRPGSVTVPKLFEVETYPSLHTMTSDVVGELQDNVKTSDILKAMFPCGSVTGAPKIRAMEVISDLEATPRGPYTGSIGYIAPDGDFQFNVAIRTLTAFKDGTYLYPVGSGIVADSHPIKEFDECMLKSRILKDEAAPFDLIETIGWSESKGFKLLSLHLNRLERSAIFFQRAFDRQQIKTLLNEAVVQHGSQDHQRIRLTMAPDGRLNITVTPIELGPKPADIRFTLSDATVDAADPLLRHKTTRRSAYTSALAAQQVKSDCQEVVFSNQYGELTEGSWTNLFVEEDGKFLTPPLSSGLLPGVLREYLLDSSIAHEAVLTIKDLKAASKIYLGNSVRGLMPATWVDGDTE